MGKPRNFNHEFHDSDSMEDGRKYAYSFDYDVMHPYMIRSFEPFFRPGSLLELWCFKGDFTERFLPYFDDVT